MRAAHWTAVTAVAAEHWGLISAGHLAEIGCSRREVDRAVERGLIQPFRRRVHLVAGTPPSPFQPILAACLAAGPGTLASFLSAAWLWDFGHVLSHHLEVTTLHGPTRDLRDIRMHRTTKVLTGDATRRHGVPVTSAARSALDLASMLSPRLLARFVDHVHRQHYASYEAIDRHLQQLGGRGRSGTRKLRAVLGPRLEGLAAGDNDAEVDVVEQLVRLGVPRPSQQVQVVAGPKVYVLDAAWTPAKVGLELLGFDPHGTIRAAFDADREREIRLRQAGWEVVSVTTRTDLRLVARYLRTRLPATISEFRHAGGGELRNGR
jgi:hypothetical protein